MAKICRTCLQETSSPNYYELTSDDKSAQIKIEMLLCIPEIDLNLLENPILCVPCLSTLNTSYRFKKQCLYTEERIRSYISAKKHSSDVKILDIYNSCNLLGLLFDRKEIPPVASPKRNYIDDLNDLLDDALNKKDIPKILDIEQSIDTVLPVPIIKQECPDAVERTTVVKVHTPTPQQEPNTNNTESTLNWMKCKHCRFKTQNLGNFQLHQKRCSSSLFSCDHCSFKTRHKQSFKKHNEHHVTNKIISCTLCPFKTIKFRVLQIHINKEHRNLKLAGSKKKPMSQLQKTFACPACTYSGKILSDLKAHVHDKHQRKLYTCSECPKMLLSEERYKKHLKMHRPSIGRSGNLFKCPLCNYVNASKNGIAGHVRSHIHEREAETT